MLTSEQVALNRAQAVNEARAQQGLTDIPPSSWTYEQRIAYNKVLAGIIASRPEQFQVSDVNVAVAIQNANPSALDEDSFAADLGVFGGEFKNQAFRVGAAVASVGEGVITTLGFASWAIPVAALVVAGILLYSFKKKQIG